MLNVCFTGNKIWRQSKINVIRKPGKDSAIPKNYISLLCHTYKLYERMILNRRAPVVEQRLIKEQAGFRTAVNLCVTAQQPSFVSIEPDPTHWRRLPERHDHRCSLRWLICCLRHKHQSTKDIWTVIYKILINMTLIIYCKFVGIPYVFILHCRVHYVILVMLHV